MKDWNQCEEQTPDEFGFPWQCTGDRGHPGDHHALHTWEGVPRLVWSTNASTGDASSFETTVDAERAK